MSFTIAGMGTALPRFSIGLDESVRYAQEYFCATDEERRKLFLLYRMAGVKRRYSVLLDGPEGPEVRHSAFPRPAHAEDRGPTMRQRMVIYERESTPLAVQAARAALDDACLAPAEVTHLITVSCSGFAAPGVDIGLIKALDLRPTVERAHVGFMGCHGALNGLRVGRGFTHRPEARVLLCAVELCSLHYHYGWDPDRVVANALFADGAAALVGLPTNPIDDECWRIADTGSCLIPDSEDAMTWRLGDHGFEMSLSARVPELIASHLRPWMEQWLKDKGLSLDAVRSWAVHPGGPRILTSVTKALGLPDQAMQVSKDMLRDHGNMSSPTVLFILKRLRLENAPRPCVALGFGPGLMAEAVLFA